MAGGYFYNVNNHTPEQPVIVSTCAPAAGNMKSSLHLRRDTAVWPYDSVLKYYASDKSGAVLQGE